MIRLFVSLCLLLVAVAGTAISPEDIAAARQACTHQCQDNDKIVMAKCMRACWKNFFDGHQTTTTRTTTQNKRVVAATKKPVARHVVVNKPKAEPVHPKSAAAKAVPVHKSAAAPKRKVVQSAFAEVKHAPYHGQHSVGMRGRRSMAALLRSGASTLAMNAGLLVFLLAAGSFLMA